MSAIYPTYPKGAIKPVKGKGSWLWDEAGKSYLDFTSGIGVCQLGHTPTEVKNRVVKQLDQLWHTSNLFEIEPQQQLAERLTKLSKLDYAFFANSGAEANEAAIKLARRYQQKVKNNNKFEVITFDNSFHGRTLATLTATGQSKVKEGYNPLPQGFVTIPYGSIVALKETINEQTAAIMLEVIQGEGGVHPAEAAWLIEVGKLAKENDILLMIDEVQTGIGRTGKWFGYQHYPIQPDVITVAKGLGSGFPIGAVLGCERTKEAFSLGSHGSTFGGNFITTTAALATLDEIEQKDILSNVNKLGNYLIDYLSEKLACYPEFIEIRGKGLMIGIEWSKPVIDLVQISKEQGLLVLMAGPNTLRLLPPLNISKEELDKGLKQLLVSIKKWLPESTAYFAKNRSEIK